MLLEELFSNSMPVIGVIHLLPLPGSPRFDGQLDKVLARAEQEALALASGGVDGIIVENFFDAPFAKNRVDTATACALTLAAKRVKEISALPLGINVLRNDGHSALAIATAAGADFIRINVLAGAMVTDQGLIESEAHDLLMYRKTLQMEQKIRIFADVMVKHAIPLGTGLDIKQAAKDTVHRSMADVVIVSGSATGSAPAGQDLQAVREALPDTPLLVGSRTTRENAAAMLGIANGIIVATSVKRRGVLENPVDVERVRALVDTVKASRNPGGCPVGQ